MSITHLSPATLAKDIVLLLALLFSLTFFACTKTPSQARTEQPATVNAPPTKNTLSAPTPSPKMTPKPTPSATPNANAGPPDDQIKSVVAGIIKYRLTNNNFQWRTTSININSVEILRRGEFHPNEKFFLIQVRTKGTKQEKWTGGGSCTFCDQRCEF